MCIVEVLLAAHLMGKARVRSPGSLPFNVEEGVAPGAVTFTGVTSRWKQKGHCTCILVLTKLKEQERMDDIERDAAPEEVGRLGVETG